MSNSVAVILPTYNRPECIKNLCNISFPTVSETNFNIYVLDSSTNDDTEDLIKSFNSCNQNLISYQRFDASFGADKKVIASIPGIKEDYIYILGDGNLVNFQMLSSDLFENRTFDFAFVDIEGSDRLGRLNQDIGYAVHKLYVYDDIQTYIAKYFSHLTYWGASIVRTDLLKVVISTSLASYSFDEITWWLPCLLVECLGITDLTPGVIYTPAVTYNSGKPRRSWDRGEAYYKIVFEIFNKDIDRLPQWVTADTRSRLIEVFRHDALVTDDYLFSKRIEGTINLKLTFKYKKDIERISGYYWKMILISITPRLVVRYINLCKLGISKISKIVRGKN